MAGGRREVALLISSCAASAFFIAFLFARYAPEPYMDEIFHVPQAQLYCAGRWQEWHPKITTFPGLYILGAVAGRATSLLQGILAFCRPLMMQHGSSWDGNASGQGSCSTLGLRAVNLVFALACVPLFYRAAQMLDPSRSQAQLLLLAAAGFFFPLHFFFAFLYYTDVPSLFFTLATHLAALHRRPLLAGAAAVAAVGMRQTNAVWVAFSLGCAVLERCLPEGAAAGSAARRKKGDAAEVDASSGSGSGTASGRGGDSAGALQQLRREAGLVLRRAWTLRAPLAAGLWPLAGVVAAFAAFVVWNGGVVVGDKAHHEPVRHLMQPLYFAAYAAVALAPVVCSPAALAATARALATSARRSPVATLAALGAAAAVLAAAAAHGTLVHPFLLADNRHYTFYLWRRLLDRTRWARFAAIPAYLYCLHALHARLAHRPVLWRLGLAAATCLVLVPAHLLEPRYFTTPFYMLLLHARTPSPRQLAATASLYALADAATVYAFLFRPFVWGDGSVARFIW